MLDRGLTQAILLRQYNQNNHLTINMNKSPTPSKKNVLNRTPTSHQRSSASKSPLKRNPLCQMDIQQKLKGNREKLSHTLDTYTMLIRSNNQIRCLQHNSVVSIFCETENKLLCASCVFGKNEHKFHKMWPIDKSFEKMEESVLVMQGAVERQVNTLESIKHIVLHNLDEEIIEMEKGMQVLTMRYAQAHQLLDHNFEKAKETIISLLQGLKVKHETVAMELQFLRDVYDVKLPLINLDFTKLDTGQILIYHHSLLYTLSNQKKFEGNVWNVPSNDLRRVCGEQDRKIKKINEDLINNLKFMAA